MIITVMMMVMMMMTDSARATIYRRSAFGRPFVVLASVNLHIVAGDRKS